MAEPSEWRLQSGQYLGEISALCFVHLPSNLSSIPYLLAGTGSQIIFYDLATGNMIRSFQVFEGIRVHGICCAFFDCREESGSFKLAFKVVVFGERRVKLFNLHVELASESNNRQLACVELILFRSLPKFSHWVLDVCFLKDSVISMQQGNHCLAIGCSDNSVCFWDMLKANVNYEIRCPDKCLLYSMRMWGDKVEALHIASGTIFNEIIVWKVVRQNLAPFFNSPEKDHSLPASSSDVDLQIHSHQYEAFPVCRLVGHEGSIFQIAWSSNGSKLLSVSDDRSARIWELNAERTISDNLAEEVVSHSVGPVLFGHSARVWDCCITDYLIITVGEDCTCRVWGLDGIQLKMIKEHIGRGVWRCLYDPNSSLLVTAGFDSAIKVHQLRASLSKGPERIIEVAEEYIDKKEIFTTRIPNSSEHVGLMDSKSEYVRCLQFKNEDTLYVATNKGYLFHAKVSDTGDIKWTELLRVSEEVPIVCMNLLSRNPSDLSCEVEDWVAVGDGKGSVTVVGIVGDIWAPKVGLAYTWSAEIERQLLGTFCCKSLGYRFIFTADPRGTLKLWRLCGPLQSVSHNAMRSHNASLVAEFVSCFALRIMCLAASFQEEVLVCGDLRGNVILFPLLSGLLFETSNPSEAKISPINYFKGAHGISSVCSVSIASSSSSQVEIHSTGGDGCICYLEYGSDQQRLEFIGMKQVNELSLIRSVFYDAKICDDSASGNYAIGFASADFIIWNLITETKVAQIPCGGWRRPHSYYLGDVPEMKNCFAFVKDETIYIHRHWIPGTEKKIYPQNLHLQFHGREMHSLSFISEDSRFSSNKNQDLFSKSSWIATGCEDGTVRLTRYAQGLENWSASKLLGEHVGGSSVRSICSVSKMHIIAADMTSTPSRQKTTLEDLENPFLLISVGSKRVLTAWKQKVRMNNKKEEILAEEPDNPSSMSYRWLSTDMPAKNCSTREKVKREKDVGTIENLCSVNPDKVSDSLSPENSNFDSKICIEDKFENDWRYLAVTAFLVKVADSRVSVCFVVVACSDATVAVRALVLPYRLWYDIAVLVPLASPVLALQHVIISDSIPNLYLVISGCTDGSIGFWDLTENVETFMRRVSSLQMDDYIDCQKRPRTGRGSQGGRWWRSFPKKKSGDISVSSKTDDSTQNHVTHVTSPNPNHVSRSATVSSHVKDPSEESEARADDFLLEICEIWPLHMLNNVHQSGVNCLHVSDIKDSRCSNSGLMFYVISGGDDQALHCLRFDLTRVLSSHYSDNMTPEMHSIDKLRSLKNSIHYLKKQNYQIRLSFHEKILSAHSSAVKGVWTDGHWVFSTGLDQRVRCWCIEEHAKLTESAQLIISVPEPEALDARACARNHYQIAVAGRGMQMVEFFAPDDMERESSGL